MLKADFSINSLNLFSLSSFSIFSLLVDVDLSSEVLFLFSFCKGFANNFGTSPDFIVSEVKRKVKRLKE